MQDTAFTASLKFPLGRRMAYVCLPTEIREMIWSLLLPSDKTFRFVQHKQSETLPAPGAAAPPRAEKQTQSSSVLPDLLTLLKHTFSEVAYTFGSANNFCFDIRDADAIRDLKRTARSYIYHVHLVDRLAYDLRTINIKELIRELRGLKSISIPVYPEPFMMSSFATNSVQREMNLSVARDFVEQLEEGCYTQLFLDYSQPRSLIGPNPDELLTIKLLRHVRSTSYYSDQRLTRLWLDMYFAWIYSHPGKRTKLQTILAQMDSTYKRSFLTCVVEAKNEEEQIQGFKIALVMPK